MYGAWCDRAACDGPTSVAPPCRSDDYADGKPDKKKSGKHAKVKWTKQEVRAAALLVVCARVHSPVEDTCTAVVTVRSKKKVAQWAGHPPRRSRP